MKSSKTNYSLEKRFNPTLFIVIILVAAFGSILGIKFMVTFGISPYSAILGVMFMNILAKVPILHFKQFHSIHQQNLIQTSITCATFGAANCLLIPLGIPYLLGREDLLIPMLIGAGLSMLIDTVMMYRLFDTPLYPASENWPQGIATAGAIQIQEDQRKNRKLFNLGMAFGSIGSFFRIPLSAIGIAIISQTLPIAMLGFGMLIPSFSMEFFNIDLGKLYLPHGIMIGAGLVVLGQSLHTIFFKKTVLSQENHSEQIPSLQKTTIYSMIVYSFIAVIVVVISGFITEMSLQELLSFILFAIVANFLQRLIVGKTSMKTGFIPAFSLAFVFLVIGLLIGFPLEILGILVGLTAATGPVFSTMGYALKAGYILRGNGNNPDLEKSGRFRQLMTVWITLGVAMGIIAFSHQGYFSQQLIPPIDYVFVTTMKASISTEVIQSLLLGAILGGGLQLFRGTGILFATGLLLMNPTLGWFILLGVVFKLFMSQKYSTSNLNIFAAGLIAGDVLGSLISSVFPSGK